MGISVVRGMWPLWLLLNACSVPEATACTELRVGVLPDQSPQRLREQHGPVIEHLSEQLGLPVELVVPRDYAHLLELFASERIQLAYFGGLTYLRAHERSGALPLVLRDVDLSFTTVFVTAREEVRRIEDCRGQSLSYGSRLSTSGYLMPYHFLQDRRIQPETFFAETTFSGSHEATALAVRDNRVCAGAANSHVIRAMYRDGTLSALTTRVIWETPPYADYVWAVSGRLPAGCRTSIREAFLQLESDNPIHGGILRAQHAGSYMPARHGDFFALERAAVAARLMD